MFILFPKRHASLFLIFFRTTVIFYNSYNNPDNKRRQYYNKPNKPRRIAIQKSLTLRIGIGGNLAYINRSDIISDGLCDKHTQNGACRNGNTDNIFPEKAEQASRRPHITVRSCSNRNWRTSFRHILPLTALKILDGRQPACGFLPCHQQNMLENPHTIPIGSASKYFSPSTRKDTNP